MMMVRWGTLGAPTAAAAAAAAAEAAAAAAIKKVKNFNFWNRMLVPNILFFTFLGSLNFCCS